MNTFGQFHQESLKFDKRLISMNEKSGLLAPGEYQQSIQNLPDLQHNAVPMSLKSGNEAAAAEPVEEVASASMGEAPGMDPQPAQAPTDYSQPTIGSPAVNPGYPPESSDSSTSSDDGSGSGTPPDTSGGFSFGGY